MPIRKPIFIIPHDLGVVATSNARNGFPAAHLNRHKAIGLVWQTIGNLTGQSWAAQWFLISGTWNSSRVWIDDVPWDTAFWARGQFSASRPIDFCAIVSANAQPGTQYRLRLGTTQAQVDGTAPYDSGNLPFISPSITRDDGRYHSHLEIPTVQNATWWRIDITGHTGDFQASNLVLGRKVEPSKFYNADFEFGVEDLGSAEFTRFGVMNEEPGIILRTANFTLGWQTEAEFETSFRPMMETLGKRGIIYVVFDPDPTTYRQSKTFMGIFRKSLYARAMRKPKTYQQEFDILSFI